MSDFHQRLASRAAALLMAGGLVAGCSSPSPGKIDYRSDTKVKQASLAVPPNLLDETSDERSLAPVGGQASLSAFQQVQTSAPAPDENSVLPQVPGMHIQREGTESWLVIDNRTPNDVWAQVRRFWQEQGFLLVVDQRDKGVMETDWNETHPKINDGLIRNALTWATDNSYVTAERNKYRTRLEPAPNGGTYVFISQKGLREVLTGTNNDNSTWQAKPNDPALETEYLKRLMMTLARAKPGVPDAQVAAEADAASAAKGGKGAKGAKGAADPAAAAIAAQNVANAAQPEPDRGSGEGAQTEVMLGEPYDRAWVRVGVALDRANFTVDDRDRTKGIYYVRYVDPRDMTSAQQGFWNQVFHGRKEKVAKQYRLNVRAITQTQTRVAIVDAKGDIDTSRPAREIMSLVVDQLQ